MEEGLLANIFGIFKRYRFRFFHAILLVLVSNFLSILNPLILRQALFALEPQEGVEKGILDYFFSHFYGSYYTSVWIWALSLVLTAACSSYLKYRMRICFITISREEERRIREEIFKKVQTQSQKFYDKHSVGELISFLTNDIGVYREILGPGIMYPIFSLTLLIPSVIALFFISQTLAILALLPLLLIPIFNAVLRRYIYFFSKKVQEKLAVLSRMAQEHFSAISIIKAYGAEKNVGAEFHKTSKSLSFNYFYLSCLQGLLQPLFSLLTKITTVLLVILAGFIILKKNKELLAADFISFMWIQSYIYIPVLMLGWVIPLYERGRAAFDRIVSIYNEPVEVVDQHKSAYQVPENATIELKDLTFTYPKQTLPALKNLSLKIEGGSFVGITGPVGAGKSTLFKLIDREYEVPSGMIYVGGREIHEYSLDHFYKQVVSVNQAPFLFSNTVAENVRFGSQEASLEDIEIVSKYADLHETVLEFPQKYETIVGERGVKLSGGQKKRVAIARAFLVNRSVLLLDDIFSSVDLATEKRIFKSMQKNFKGKTIVLITHRVSILEQLDRVIYMADGQVLEDGSPLELKKNRDHYWALFELQNLSAL